MQQLSTYFPYDLIWTSKFPDSTFFLLVLLRFRVRKPKRNFQRRIFATMTGKFLEQPFKQSTTIFSKSEEPRAPYVNREISSSGFRKVRGWLRSFSWIREDTVTWKIFVKTFIIVRVVSRRVGEPSKIALLDVEEGEKRIYRAPFPRFLSLNDAFYAGVKTFFAKKRVRANVDGATRRRDKDGGSVMILEMIYSFSSPRLPSFLPTQEDETIEHRRCVNDFAHCLYIYFWRPERRWDIKGSHY